MKRGCSLSGAGKIGAATSSSGAWRIILTMRTHLLLFTLPVNQLENLTSWNENWCSSVMTWAISPSMPISEPCVLSKLSNCAKKPTVSYWRSSV